MFSYTCNLYMLHVQLYNQKMSVLLWYKFCFQVLLGKTFLYRFFINSLMKLLYILNASYLINLFVFKIDFI